MKEPNVPGVEPQSTKTASSRIPFATTICIALLLLQPIVFFRAVLIHPTAHIPFDLAGFHLPLLSYNAQCVRGGVAPFWDPYQYCGAPIHADIQAQTFYPPAWAAILLGNADQGHKLFLWVEWMIPLHMIAGGLFAFWLLRRMGLRHPAALLGATVYQVGAYFASQPQHLGAICAAAWLPLALLAVFEMRRGIRARWVAALGIAISMSILSGFVATTEATAIAVALFLLALWALREGSWRMIPAAAAGFALGAAISAVELVPMLLLSRVSMASLRSQWYIGAGGMPLQSLVSLLSPNHYHIFDLANYKLPDNFTYLYAYCGLATLALLAAAPFIGKARARAFLTLTALSGMVMLGEHVPGVNFLFTRLPGMIRGSFYVEHMLMAFTCFAGITAAVVLDRLGKRLPEAALWAVALLTAADLIYTGHGKPMNAYEGSYKVVETEYGIPERPNVTDRLRKLAGVTDPPARVDYTDDVFSQGLRGSDLLRIPTASGDNPFVLLRLLYTRRLFCGGMPWNRNLPVKNPASPLLDMMNVGWVAGGAALPEDDVRKAGLEPVDTVDGIHIYRNPRALPRFFLASSLARSSGEEETLAFLARANFDPAHEAVVEGIPSNRAGLGSGDVKVRLYSPNRIELQTTASAPAFLVTSEAMYPGWQATVNGAAAPLLLTNGAFRGLSLPAGSSEIVMEYHPRYFWPCAFLSIAALAFAAAAATGLLNPRRAQ